MAEKTITAEDLKEFVSDLKTYGWYSWKTDEERAWRNRCFKELNGILDDMIRKSNLPTGLPPSNYMVDSCGAEAWEADRKAGRLDE
jgi:hypothetical protein